MRYLCNTNITFMAVIQDPPKNANRTFLQLKFDEGIKIEQWLGEKNYKEIQSRLFIGNLIGVAFKESKGQKGMIYEVKLILADGEDQVILKMNLNNVAKMILNKVYELPLGTNVALLFFTDKEKGHAVASVKVGEKEAKKAFEADKMPWEDKEKWIRLCVDLAKKYAGFKPVDELDSWAEKAATLNVPKAEPEPAPIADDDLPF